MTHLSPNLILVVFAAVQVIGLIAAWLARASQGSSDHGLVLRLFFVALALVAASVIGSILFSPGLWIVPGVTLSVMIVGTTCDFRRPEQAGSF